MRKLLVALLALLIAVPPAYAQERKTYGQAELDQMLAPVALYAGLLALLVRNRRRGGDDAGDEP